MKEKKKLVRLVLCALFAALIVVMTFTPYLGYITVGIIEITTLHVVVILGAVILGPKYGAILGGVWGLTCVMRAFQFGIIPFQNPLVSLVPRLIVGLVAGLVFYGLSKTKCPKPIALIISAFTGTLTNTVLVLGSLKIFGGFETLFGEAAKTLEVIIGTLISTNGLIELVAALVLVPSIYMATEKVLKDKI
ncbi:MAG: ECF transporter S component [Clostridia bacterium]|nr:ECF transporter S component [Clostridia bacterium]